MRMKHTLKNTIAASEIAARAGCSRQYIDRMLQDGEIPAEKLGRWWVIRRKDAQVWLDQRRRRMRKAG